MIFIPRGLMYRDKETPFWPLKGSSARTLGVRVKPEGDSFIKHSDITVDKDGNVKPGGGMSVNIGSPKGMQSHRLSETHGGKGPDPMWKLNAETISKVSPQLILVPDKGNKNNPNHATIQPAYKMSYEEYENALYQLQTYCEED